MGEKYIRCKHCGELFRWESGHYMGGNIYCCEDCGDYFCGVCYEEKTGINVGVMVESDVIQCPDCINKGRIVIYKKDYAEIQWKEDICDNLGISEDASEIQIVVKNIYYNEPEGKKCVVLDTSCINNNYKERLGVGKFEGNIWIEVQDYYYGIGII